MITGYIAEQGSVVRIKGERLQVTVKDTLVQELRFTELRTLVVIGNVSLTTAAIAVMLDRSIAVSFLSMGGKFRGRLEPPTSTTLETRRAQFRALEDNAFGCCLARSAIEAKLINCRTTLLRSERHHPVHPAADNAPRSIRLCIERLHYARSADEIRGIEGDASAAYFGQFGHILSPLWTFDGRNRRPPLDPPNALLSLGYTLLLVRCLAALQIAGLDPDLGFLHTSHHGSPALALDMMEEFRPSIVDALVLQTLNGGVLKPDDFVQGKSRPVELSHDAFRTFLREFERRLGTQFTPRERASPTTYSDFLHHQAETLRRAFTSRDATQYRPHTRR